MIGRFVFGMAVTLAPALLAIGTARAEPVNLEGSWSGGGMVNLSSGASEKARCRAHFTRQSANSFGMNAICATPSARVAQTATLSRVGANRFAGSFYNSEYNVSGTINLTVNANRLSASLSGAGSSAQLSLGR